MIVAQTAAIVLFLWGMVTVIRVFRLTQSYLSLRRMQNEFREVMEALGGNPEAIKVNPISVKSVAIAFAMTVVYFTSLFTLMSEAFK